MAGDFGYLRVRQVLLFCEAVCSVVLVSLSLAGMAARSTQSLKIWVSLLLILLTLGRFLELVMLSDRLLQKNAKLLRDNTWLTSVLATMLLILHFINVVAMLSLPDVSEIAVGRPSLAIWLWRWLGFFVPLNFIVAVAYPVADEPQSEKALDLEGARSQELEEMTRVVLETPPEADVTCSICLQDMVEGEAVRVLHCSHFFHDDCIASWAKHPRRGGSICTWRCTVQSI